LGLDKLAILSIVAIVANLEENMINITATEFKNRVGRYLDVAETDPVLVEKSGRPKSVLISHRMYEKFMILEDAYWANKAAEAEAEGYLGEKSTNKILKDLE
jgi:antitoxin Phd